MRPVLSVLMVLICLFMIGTAGSAEDEEPFSDPILNEKAKEYAPIWEKYISDLNVRDVAHGYEMAILVLKDGTIEISGAHTDGTGYQQFNTNPWENITAVSTTDNEDIPILAGLCEDGTAVVTGRVPEEWNKALEGKHFKEVAAGYVGEPGIFVPADWYGVNYLACLQDDGRVWILYTAEGETMTAYLDWNDITAIAASSESITSHLVGLKTDGTVVAAGNNQEGQCDVSGWRNIISIAKSMESDSAFLYIEKSLSRSLQRFAIPVSSSVPTFFCSSPFTFLEHSRELCRSRTNLTVLLFCSCCLLKYVLYLRSSLRSSSSLCCASRSSTLKSDIFSCIAGKFSFPRESSISSSTRERISFMPLSRRYFINKRIYMK